MRLRRSLLMPAAVLTLAGFSSPAAHASSHMIIPPPTRPVGDCLRLNPPPIDSKPYQQVIRCDIAIHLSSIPARDSQRVAARGVDRYRMAARRDPERVAARGGDRFHAQD
jgi:hypothetical protein